MILTYTYLVDIVFQKQVTKNNKRKRGSTNDEVIDIDSDGEHKGELVSLSSIERLVKRAKQDKSERMESVKEGREDREKYGFRVSLYTSPTT